MNELTTELRAALAAEADRAPAPARWSPTHRSSPVGGDDRSRPAWVYTAGIAATAASVVGLLLIAGRETTPENTPATASTPVPSMWAPPGAPFPLDDLGPVERIGGDSVALSSLTRRIGVENHPALTVYTSVGYVGGESIEEWRCLASDGGGAGCSPLDRTGPDIGVTSSIDNRLAEFDLWTWSNVPPDADYVVYVDGDDTRWQVPVAGVAAFPNSDWFDSVAVAYTDQGEVVARVDASVLESAQQENPATQPLVADLEASQAVAVGNVMTTTATECLEDAGAIFETASVGQLSSEATDEVWSNCVLAAEVAVEEWLATNSIEFYDPTTVSPTADEPFIVYSD